MSTSAKPILRFAPSPNGRLHLGHALSAGLNAAIACRLGGTFLLRIEDIDTVRCTPDQIAACREDLAWLGMSWPEPALQQSTRFPIYRKAADRLRARGLLYPCRCSRRDIARAVAEQETRIGSSWPRDPDGAPLYPGTCRHFPPSCDAGIGTPGFAWRLDMTAALTALHNDTAQADSMPLAYPAADIADLLAGREMIRQVPVDPARWGDAVLIRKDVPASYHLAVVVDDAEQGITHVVRGQDLEAATDLHVLLQRLLGLPTPIYAHHALIRDAEGEKLAKSRSAPSLAERRNTGDTPAAIRARLGLESADLPADAATPEERMPGNA